MIVAAAALVACSDNVDEGDDVVAGELLTVRKISLSVDGGLVADPAEPATRAMGTDFQNSEFAEGTQVGVFILTAADYLNNPSAPAEPVTPPSGVYDSEAQRLIDDAYRTGKYIYENVKATIAADGSLQRADGLDFIYPVLVSESVAIIAYAPYKEGVTIDNLTSGMLLQVAADQSAASGMQASDVLMAVPSQGNPMRTSIGQAVSLTFRHVMSNIQLNLKINNEKKYRSDSIIVKLKNVRRTATLMPLLSSRAYENAEFTGAVFGNDIGENTDAVVIARIKGINAGSGTVVERVCNAIVPPQAIPAASPLAFEITFKRRTYSSTDLVVEEPEPTETDVALLSGKKRLYNASIP